MDYLLYLILSLSNVSIDFIQSYDFVNEENYFLISEQRVDNDAIVFRYENYAYYEVMSKNGFYTLSKEFCPKYRAMVFDLDILADYDLICFKGLL